MPTYKLKYFPARGAAELIRLIFKLADKEFEDVRIPGEEWAKCKTDMPLQAMPVLEVDGKPFCQSSAIARYLSKTFGLMGKTTMDEFKIDELFETCSEIASKHFSKIYMEQDAAKKKDLIVTFVKDGLPLYMDFIEKKLKESGTGYYLGTTLTVADLMIYSLFHTMSTWFTKCGGPDPMTDRPELKKHCDKVASEPKIAAWIKNRPETEY